MRRAAWLAVIARGQRRPPANAPRQRVMTAASQEQVVKLLPQAERFVRSKTAKGGWSFHDRQEILSEARLALCDAVLSYDPAKASAPLDVYALQVTWYRCIDWIRRTFGTRLNVRPEFVELDTRTGYAELIEPVAPGDGTHERAVARELEAAILALPPSERAAVVAAACGMPSNRRTWPLLAAGRDRLRPAKTRPMTVSLPKPTRAADAGALQLAADGYLQEGIARELSALRGRLVTVDQVKAELRKERARLRASSTTHAVAIAWRLREIQ